MTLEDLLPQIRNTFGKSFSGSTAAFEEGVGGKAFGRCCWLHRLPSHLKDDMSMMCLCRMGPYWAVWMYQARSWQLSLVWGLLVSSERCVDGGERVPAEWDTWHCGVEAVEEGQAALRLAGRPKFSCTAKS